MICRTLPDIGKILKPDMGEIDEGHVFIARRTGLTKTRVFTTLVELKEKYFEQV